MKDAARDDFVGGAAERSAGDVLALDGQLRHEVAPDDVDENRDDGVPLHTGNVRCTWYVGNREEHTAHNSPSAHSVGGNVRRDRSGNDAAGRNENDDGRCTLDRHAGNNDCSWHTRGGKNTR